MVLSFLVLTLQKLKRQWICYTGLGYLVQHMTLNRSILTATINNNTQAEFINKIKTSWSMAKKKTRKFQPEQMPSLLINNKKGSEKSADSLNGFFLTIADIFHLYQVRKEDAISLIKVEFPGIKIIPTTETEIKV